MQQFVEDFQGRRAGIRFRREETGKVEFVHTLTDPAWRFLGRTLVCDFGEYQQPDGQCVDSGSVAPLHERN
jgi:seryl-tRNA synthetase